MSARFIHLRVHSAYSLLEGAIPVAKLVDATMRMDMPAVALTDRNNLFGALEFSLKAASAGVQPIIGVTLAMARPAYAQDERRLAEGRQEHDWLILLAQNESGYQNLIKLVSKAHLSGDGLTTPHIDFADLESHHEGLILLTGGIDGTLGGLIAEGKTDVAHRFLDALKTLFGDRVYVELSRHDRADEDAVETGLIDLAYALNVGLVATNQAYFLNRNQFDAHDALMCIAAGTVVDSQNRERLTPDFRLKSADEMVALFADLPEAIANSVEIAKRCAFKVQTRDPILPNFTQGKGVSETEMLEDEVAKGLEARLEAVVYPQHPDRDLGEVAAPYRERMAYELGIINQMGFPGYFLIVADFIQWAKDKGIPVGPGRGSGAGSVVAWALKITDLDPLRFNLLFERFLNPERVSMPDFDVDFCQERRDEVIRYVQEKYGDDHVAQIITFGKLKARAVLRDVGRVLNLPYPQVDGLCKLIPDDPANPTTLGKALENISELKRERRSDERVAQLMDLSLELEGLYRHASTHAAGVVIGDRPLDELIPLYRDPRSTMPVTQFDMKWVEQAGLVKFDFLGLKTLSVLRMAVEFCADRGLEIDLDHLPLDDATTYALLARGDTAGVFQLESEGMRAALAGLKPDKFEDIIALVSLYRPGPMDNIPTYINRKHGREEVDYLHPSLREVLDETYGVIIYQEQVMQIAQILAGYSLGEADLLRRAMGKKKKEEMDAQRERFSEGAARKGVDPDKATYIFDLVAKFAGYGFNKSHAAAYALVAYQTAYLKANAPVEFMAATMAFELNNTDKLAEFVEEARRMDISVLPPNVNRSQVNFSVETHEGGLAIRYALAAVKNVGKSAMEMLVGARANAEACAFSDWYDFAQRLDPLAANKRLLENLVRAGALDDLHHDRSQLFANVDILLKVAQQAQSDRGSSQNSLFDSPDFSNEKPRLKSVEPWLVGDRVRAEHQALGFYLTAHPLDEFDQMLTASGAVSGADAAAQATSERQTVVLAGQLIDVFERRTRQNKDFTVVKINDRSGFHEIRFFREQAEAAKAYRKKAEPVLIEAEVEKRGDDDRVGFTGRRIESLIEKAAARRHHLEIFVASREALQPMQNLLARCPEGPGTVSLVLPLREDSSPHEGRERHYGHGADRVAANLLPKAPDVPLYWGEVSVLLKGKWSISAEVRAAIAALKGVEHAKLEHF